MTAASLVNLALGLLQLVLGNLKANNTTNTLNTLITGIEAAIASLEAVQGTPVTYDQLEQLRAQPKW